jgi:hypothetical protein
VTTARQTIGVNTLWWVQFRHGVHHGVSAFQPPHNRALYHLLTWADMVGLKVITTHNDHSLVLVVDQYIGTLPVVAHDEWMARAIAEEWNRRVRSREIDPADVEKVMAWAREVVDRTPRARLITEVPWPETLPRTPFNPDGEATSR